jgi:hypothetical protein
MKIKSYRLLAAICCSILLGACANGSDSAAGAKTTTAAATQTCRKYVTNITDTTNTITYACTFNGSTTLTCTNGGTETVTYTYANLKAFVDEAAAPVSVFNRSRYTSLVMASATSTLVHNFTLTYNASGQKTSASDSGPGFTAVYTNTAWDTNNRATAVTATYSGGVTCNNRTYTIAYDDTLRKATWTQTSAGIGANCGTIGTACNDQADADGNPTSSSLCRNFTVNSTATVCY